ncbi:MAG TPA: CpXC domain-containing protein [Kofleriaceae bacterium]
MSTFEPARIRCTCGAEQDVTLANGLHISKRPDIRQQILEGTFHRFPCPACGGHVQIETLLAYTDFPKQHWFTIVPEDELPWRGERVAFAKLVFQRNMVERAAPMIQDLAPKMKQRVIFGLASLREKIICFDADLDDRLVEALKLQLMRDLELPFTGSGYFHLVEVNGNELVFELSPSPEATPTKRMTIPRSMLDELAHDSAQVEAALPELWNDIVVDYRVMLIADASARA